MNKPQTSRHRLREFSRSLPMVLLRTREAVMTRFRPMRARHHLTEQQWRVLRILNDHGAMIIAELTKLSCIHKASMSRIIVSLEQAGLIEKRASETDARARRLGLSKSGAAMMKRLMPIADEIYDGIIADFGAVKYKQLLSLLRDLSRINSCD